jgi:sugar lactone lactonase YvrE
MYPDLCRSAGCERKRSRGRRRGSRNASARCGGVEEYAPGSTTGTELNIPIHAPGGIQIDGGGNLIVANPTLPAAEVFPQGATQPSMTFAQTTNPDPIRFDKKAKNLYVGDPDVETVNVYAYPSGTLVDTISNGVSFPAGVAVAPGDTF